MISVTCDRMHSADYLEVPFWSHRETQYREFKMRSFGYFLVATVFVLYAVNFDNTAKNGAAIEETKSRISMVADRV